MNIKKIFKLKKLLGLVTIFLLVRQFLVFVERYFTFRGAWKKSLPHQVWGREELDLKLSNGRKLNGLYKNNAQKKCILYCHGNGERLVDDHFYRMIDSFYHEKYDICVFDYPGYGFSQGKTTQKYFFESGKIYLDFLAQKYGLENISLLAYSIGTTLAVKLASENKVEKLVLLAPVSSRYGLAKTHAKVILQKYFFIKNSLDSENNIKKVTCDTLIVHGTNDSTTPFWMGKKLFENCGSKNKKLITVKNGSHNLCGGYNDKIKSWLDEIM